MRGARLEIVRAHPTGSPSCKPSAGCPIERRLPHRAPDAPLHDDRHRPEQTALYGLVQQHAASLIAHTEASIGCELPQFIKDESDALLECGILAHGFLMVRCT